jgi:hypothetical protein
MIARRNMRCLVAADKHVNDIRVIAMQPPITTTTTEKLLEAVFSVGSALRLYSKDSRPIELVQVKPTAVQVTKLPL